MPRMQKISSSCMYRTSGILYSASGQQNDRKFICSICVNVTKEIANKFPAVRLKVDTLERDAANCEGLLNTAEIREKKLVNKVQLLEKEIKDLKGNLRNGPALHTAAGEAVTQVITCSAIGTRVGETVVGQLTVFT